MWTSGRPGGGPPHHLDGIAQALVPHAGEVLQLAQHAETPLGKGP